MFKRKSKLQNQTIEEHKDGVNKSAIVTLQDFIDDLDKENSPMKSPRGNGINSRLHKVDIK